MSNTSHAPRFADPARIKVLERQKVAQQKAVAESPPTNSLDDEHLDTSLMRPRVTITVVEHVQTPEPLQ
jgi:hypothetical protein